MKCVEGRMKEEQERQEEEEMDRKRRGELPLFGPPPQQSGCGGQHCSQHR